MFWRAAGLPLNDSKTPITGLNINKDEVNQQTSSMGCKVEELPITYVGIPLGGNYNTTGSCDHLMDSLEQGSINGRKFPLQRRWLTLAVAHHKQSSYLQVMIMRNF